MAGKFIFKATVQFFRLLVQYLFRKKLLLELNWVIENCVIMWLKQQIKDIAFLVIFVMLQNTRTREQGAK